MSDDFSSDTATLGRLTVGGSATGALETGGDADWFKISLQAGQTYLLTMAGLRQGAGSLLDLGSVSLNLFDSQGKYINLGDLVSTADYPLILQYKPMVSGDYYLGLGHMGWDVTSLGSYTVKASLQAPDDLPSDITTTAVLPAGGSATAQFEVAGDRDWFRFHAEVGQHYTFGNKTVDAGSVPVYGTLIYDANGKLLDLGTYPFEPLSTGDYFVSAYGWEVGSYRLNAGTLADDYARNISTSAVLQPGGSFSGGLQYRGDVDAFKVNMQAGAIYTIELAADALDKAFLYLSATDAAGNALQGSTVSTANGVKLTLSPQASGEYYLRVGGHYDAVWKGVTHSPYTLSLSGTLQDDHGDSTATATELPSGGQLQGAMQTSADIDMMKVALTAGVTYGFHLQHGANDGLHLNGYGSNAVLPPSFYGGDADNFTFTAANSGTYYLGVSASYYTTIPASYSVSMTQPADDYAANPSGAGTLAVGGKASGTLEGGGGDRDWFAVTLNAGGSYTFALNGAREGAGTLEPASAGGNVLNLIDASGKVLASSVGDSNHTGSLLAYSPTANGKYYVEVMSIGRGTGSYQVVALGGPHDDFGDDMAHASLLANGVSVQGRLEIGADRDVFRLDVTAGNDYAIDLKALTQGDSNWLANVQLSVTTSSGFTVYPQVGAAAGQESYRTLSATSSDSYYITVTHGAGDTPRDYVLSAIASGKDDYTDSTQTTGVLLANGQLSGTIGVRGDKDWVKVHLDAGKTYAFNLHGASSGNGTLDVSDGAQMALHGSGGGPPLATSFVDNQGEPTMTYLSSYTADYYLEAHGSALSTGSYLLSTTIISSDTTPPLLLGVTPASGSSNVGLLDKIVLTFSEAIMQSYYSTLSLVEDNHGAVMVTGDGINKGYVVGNTLIIQPDYALRPDTSYTLQLKDGGLLDLGGNVYKGPNSFSFNTVSKTVSGSAGNDTLSATGGGQAINGGEGIDVVNYGSDRSHYTLNQANGQVSVLFDRATMADQLTGVERLHFADGALALDVDGNAGQVYRLYQAAFHRAPAQGGLGFWMAAMDHGMSLQAVAHDFMASPEYRFLYGFNNSDSDFVDQLYQNVLHRSGKPEGIAFWVDGLHNGVTREQLMADFSESAENAAALIGVIGKGMPYIPYG